MLIKSSIFIITIAACLVSAAHHEDEAPVDTTSFSFWGEMMAILFLVILSGVVAGLTLGLMSLDKTNLFILQIAGTPQQQYYASRIIPIRKNGHILLTTLLLTNTVINETLPILFDGIFSKGFLSVIVSTAVLVLFAEIIPQAVFSKHGLAIGSSLAIPVRILIVLWSPLSYPISKFLDYLLGTHTGFVYNTPEFDALIQLHDKSQHKDGTLKSETVNIVRSVFNMQTQRVHQILTPVADLLVLSSNSILEKTKILDYSKKYQYLFIHKNDQPHQILGYFLLKSLLLLKEEDLKVPVGELQVNSCLTMLSTTTVIEAMTILSQPKERDQVVLVYQSNVDEPIEPIHEKSLLASFPSNRANQHSNKMSCIYRKMIGKSCCQPSLPTTTAPLAEIIDSRSIMMVENPKVIGVLTLTHILDQLSNTRAPLHKDSELDNQQLKKMMHSV